MKKQTNIKILIAYICLATGLATGCKKEASPDIRKESPGAQPGTATKPESTKKTMNLPIEQLRGKYAMIPGNPGKACFTPTGDLISEAILKTCAQKGPGTPFGGDEAGSWLECSINNSDYYIFDSKKMCDIQREVVMANRP